MRSVELPDTSKHCWGRWQRAGPTCTLRCRRSGAEVAPRVCMPRSISVGAKVGTTLVAPSGLGVRSMLAPLAPTTHQRST